MRVRGHFPNEQAALKCLYQQVLRSGEAPAWQLSAEHRDRLIALIATCLRFGGPHRYPDNSDPQGPLEAARGGS